jgi:hypothetical protein
MKIGRSIGDGLRVLVFFNRDAPYLMPKPISSFRTHSPASPSSHGEAFVLGFIEPRRTQKTGSTPNTASKYLKFSEFISLLAHLHSNAMLIRKRQEAGISTSPIGFAYHSSGGPQTNLGLTTPASDKTRGQPHC